MDLLFLFFRRIVGIAHVEDLESIADLKLRAECETDALTLAKRLLKENLESFKHIEDVVVAAEAIAP